MKEDKPLRLGRILIVGLSCALALAILAAVGSLIPKFTGKATTPPNIPRIYYP